jgi:hypothetical protein
MNAGTRLPYEFFELRLAYLDRLAAEIPPVRLQKIERVEENCWLIPSVAKHLKIRHPAFIATYRIPVDQKRFRPERVITATYVSPIQYENWTCRQLTEEAQRVSQRAAIAAGAPSSGQTTKS